MDTPPITDCIQEVLAALWIRPIFSYLHSQDGIETLSAYTELTLTNIHKIVSAFLRNHLLQI